jgi:hypothetical protein
MLLLEQCPKLGSLSGDILDHFAVISIHCASGKRWRDINAYNESEQTPMRSDDNVESDGSKALRSM